MLSQVASPTLPSLVSHQLRQELSRSCLTFVLNLPLQAATPQALATADGAVACYQLLVGLGCGCFPPADGCSSPHLMQLLQRHSTWRLSSQPA
jgi:hypothetical protein